MKKAFALLLVLAAGAALLVACTAPTASSTSTASEPETALPDEGRREPDVDEEEDTRLAGLTLNEYPGLTITAVPEDEAFPGGATIPVRVTVENTGAETIGFVWGSGSYAIPEALFLDSKALQVVRDESYLGIMTFDYRVNQLAPGEKLEYTLNLRAIQPNEAFDDYSSELYMQQEEPLYIGEVAWDHLREIYPDLTAAAAGEYTAHAYFRYFVWDEKTETDDEGNEYPTVDDTVTGYATYSFKVKVEAPEE